MGAKKQFDGYFIDSDSHGFGNVLVLQSPWASVHLDATKKHKVKVVRLSSYAGWLESDVSFLREVPLIEGVEIFSEKVTDLTPVCQLSRLKRLSLAACRPKKALDLSHLHQVNDLFLTWRNAYLGVFDFKSLLYVNIIDYPDGNLARLKNNSRLQELKISSKSLKSLSGIEHFPRLTRLNLYQCRKLTALDEISQATSIRKLEIAKCTAISTLSPIASFSELKELAIEDCGDIESVAPIAKCKKLEFLQIAGNTNVLDGDFTKLTKLSKLKKVLLAKRRHYTHTDWQLEKR